ncbi:MAG: hypothetical protein QM619_04870 [Micropruina sp.]
MATRSDAIRAAVREWTAHVA